MVNRLFSSPRKVLLWIMVVSVVLRVAAAFYLGDTVQVLPGTQDQVSYDALAQRLVAGKGYSFPVDWYPFTKAETPTAHWSFGYSAYLAGTYLLFGRHPLAARLLQSILVGVLMPLLLFRLGARLFNPAVALLAAAWSALYPYSVYYAAALMTESFFSIGVLLILYLFLAVQERPSITNAVLLGAAIGGTTLLRQTFLPVLPWLLMWLLWEMRGRIPWRGLVVTAAISALMILPWTLRNYRVFGSFLLLNSNAGYAFWSANHPSQGSQWIANLDTVVVPIPLEWQDLNEAQLDKTLMNDAIHFIAADPVRYVVLALSKAPKQFEFWPDPNSPAISNLSRTLSFGLALPFMLAGLYISRREWRKLLPIYLLVTFYNASFLLSWPSARYRLATDTVMLLFAAVALLAVLRYVQSRRQAQNQPDAL